MGAITTVLHLLSPGDRVVSVNDVYGGTYRIFTKVYEPKGYHFELASVDVVNDGLAELLDARTRMVWVESPTNPLLNVVDIAAAADAAHSAGALCVVDNTFATPYLQRPLALGADLVVHSTTKYLGGHSDVVGGFVGTSRQRARGAPRLPPERAGCSAGAVRLLARAARSQDPGVANAPALRERRPNRGVARRARGGRARPLSGPAGAIRSTSSPLGR